MKYKIGMYGGSFNPLHLGHVNSILTAASLCEHLYLVLSVENDPNEIDYRIRFKWLKNLTEDMDNVTVITIFDDNEKYDWEAGRDQIVKAIGRCPDVVFCGSDYKGKNVWERLYKEADIYYIERSKVDISSTKLREDLYGNFEYIPKVARPYFTKKVCIIGTESCGKTQLVRKLAKYYNTTHVEEAGRYICDEAGGIDNMKPRDYFDILFKHKEMEREALKNANKVLIIDTDSLITLYYYTLGFENTDEYDPRFKSIAENISSLNNYDLYIFLEPDVKWVQDGTRTYGSDDVRQDNNRKLKEIFDKNNIKYETISGSYFDRYEQSKKLIDELLK